MKNLHGLHDEMARHKAGEAVALRVRWAGRTLTVAPELVRAGRL